MMDYSSISDEEIKEQNIKIIIQDLYENNLIIQRIHFINQLLEAYDNNESIDELEEKFYLEIATPSYTYDESIIKLMNCFAKIADYIQYGE